MFFNPLPLAGKLAGNLADHILDKLWPLEVHLRSYLGMWDEDSVVRTGSNYCPDSSLLNYGAEQLAKHEENCEVCEP